MVYMSNVNILVLIKEKFTRTNISFLLKFDLTGTLLKSNIR